LSSQIDSSTSQRRRFRPKLWALVLTVVFVAINVRLGNWQGERAEYKIGQQAQLDAALAAAPLELVELPSGTDTGVALRYRSLSLTGAFVADELFYVDNRIVDAKAGYGLLQSFRIESVAGSSRTVLVDRGWMKASGNRASLPVVDTPSGSVTISGRINISPSRNPGTFDNDAGQRLNYVSLTELSTRLKRPIEPFILEQTTGPGFIEVARPLPGASFEKNRGYQLQWYAFAAMAVILFFVLSFRKADAV
jgi:surfeit locus 1 family protein